MKTSVLARKFFETLNDQTFGEVVAWFRIENSQRESQLKYLSRIEFVIGVLNDFEIPRDTLAIIAKQLGIRTGRLRSAHSLTEHIAWAINEYRISLKIGTRMSDVRTSPADRI